MSRKTDYTKFLEMQKDMDLLPKAQVEAMSKGYFGRCRKTDLEIEKTMGRYSDEYRRPFL